MIPAMGPSRAEYPINQLKMYASALDNSLQGRMAIPRRPVTRPPVLNEMWRGERLAKSLAGLTTFAAMFTEMVAMPTPTSETIATKMRVPVDAINGASYPAGGVAEVS